MIFLRRVATPRPLVLMFDDLQWAEPTALLMLRHLTHALADAPVLLVASSRESGEHAPEQLRAALADLERGEHRGLQLAGFDDDELADLVSVAAPVADDVEARRVAAALRVETAGNPLYASQLIRHWVESGRLDDTGVTSPTCRPRVRKRYRRACATSCGAGSTRSAPMRRAS